jgi:hypothetical protein
MMSLFLLPLNAIRIVIFMHRLHFSLHYEIHLLFHVFFNLSILSPVTMFNNAGCISCILKDTSNNVYIHNYTEMYIRFRTYVQLRMTKFERRIILLIAIQG